MMWAKLTCLVIAEAVATALAAFLLASYGAEDPSMIPSCPPQAGAHQQAEHSIPVPTAQSS